MVEILHLMKLNFPIDSLTNREWFMQGAIYVFGNVDPCNGTCNYIQVADINTGQSLVCLFIYLFVWCFVYV